MSEMSEMSTASSPRKSRRRGSTATDKKVHIACNRCRHRRTRCDGVSPLPCSFCVSRRKTCEYAETEKKIPVPESVYHTLLAAQQSTISSPPQDQGSEYGDVSESLPGNMPNVVRGASGQHIYRGEGSSINWALLFQDFVNPRSRNFDRELQMEIPTYSDPTWMQRESTPTKAKLPHYDTAKRLYNAQYQYIGTIFSFCQPQDFEKRLKWVCSENCELVHREDRLAYAQVFLIFAYGLLYSLNQWCDGDGPPGFEHFKKALEFLPDVHEEGSILFVEVLSLVGYYLQNLNRRDAAFLYIGLALRMAISLGMHQEVSDPSMDAMEREHRRRVWWSVYSMDRILCVKSGNPITISDEDIDVAYPSPMAEVDLSPSPARVLSHYTQLSKILGEIGEGIYRKKRKTGSGLVASVHSIMSDLKTWYGNLPQELRLDFSKLDSELSREAVSTHLHYFSCINMTARPLLFHVIQRRLDALSESPVPDDWTTGLSKSTVLVIEKSIAAARDSTKVMRAADKRGLVATYGFMDGEHAFSSALVLVMVNVAFPINRRDAEAMESALTLLDDMAKRGNDHIRARHDLLLDLLSTNKTSSAPGSMFDFEDIPTDTQKRAIVPDAGQNTALPEFDPAIANLVEDNAFEDFNLDYGTIIDMQMWNEAYQLT